MFLVFLSLTGQEKKVGQKTAATPFQLEDFLFSMQLSWFLFSLVRKVPLLTMTTGTILGDKPSTSTVSPQLPNFGKSNPRIDIKGAVERLDLTADIFSPGQRGWSVAL